MMDSPKQNPGLRLDAAVLAGAMVEGSASGPDEFYKENGRARKLDMHEAQYSHD